MISLNQIYSSKYLFSLGLVSLGILSCAPTNNPCRVNLSSSSESKAIYSGYITWGYDDRYDRSTIVHKENIEKCNVIVQKSQSDGLKSWNKIYLATSFHCIRHMIYYGINAASLNDDRLDMMLVLDSKSLNSGKPCNESNKKAIGIRFSTNNTFVGAPDGRGVNFSASSPELTQWYFLFKKMVGGEFSDFRNRNKIEEKITQHMKKLDLATAEAQITEHAQYMDEKQKERKRTKVMALAENCYSSKYSSKEEKPIACFLSSDVFVFTLASRLGDQQQSNFHEHEDCIMSQGNLGFDLHSEVYSSNNMNVEQIVSQGKPWLSVQHIFHNPHKSLLDEIIDPYKTNVSQYLEFLNNIHPQLAASLMTPKPNGDNKTLADIDDKLELNFGMMDINKTFTVDNYKKANLTTLFHYQENTQAKRAALQTNNDVLKNMYVIRNNYFPGVLLGFDKKNYNIPPGNSGSLMISEPHPEPQRDSADETTKIIGILYSVDGEQTSGAGVIDNNMIAVTAVPNSGNNANNVAVEQGDGLTQNTPLPGKTPINNRPSRDQPKTNITDNSGNNQGTNDDPNTVLRSEKSANINESVETTLVTDQTLDEASHLSDTVTPGNSAEDSCF
ncbi:MAG: hypothetical protein OXC40_05475 [Proteobacteria bacterium]|nr:hypothetical protein [Pseudomonadota bacterium]